MIGNGMVGTDDSGRQRSTSDVGRRWSIGELARASGRPSAAARRMWDDNSEEIGRSLPWPADRMRILIAYLERVRQHLG